MRKRLFSTLRVVFALAGLAFLILAFRDAWRRSQEAILPDAVSIAIATIFVLLGLVFLAQGWQTLFDERPRALARALYVSQLGKYIPGAIWQAVGQVGLATRTGISTGHASAAYLVHAATQATAGATVAAVVAPFMTGAPTAARALVPAGVLSAVFLHRGTWVAASGPLRRLLRGRSADDHLPPQAAFWRSFAWSVAMIVALGAAFGVLLSAVSAVPPVVGTWAFVAAWTVGFLAIPFPSGLGIREAVLLGLLAGYGVAPAVIGAAVVNRLVMMGGEVAMIGISAMRGGDTGQAIGSTR